MITELRLNEHIKYRNNRIAARMLVDDNGYQHLEQIIINSDWVTINPDGTGSLNLPVRKVVVE